MGTRAKDHAIGAAKVGDGGMTRQITKAAAKRARKKNASPTGGGGGGWQAVNEKLQQSRKRRAAQANGHSVAEGATFGALSTPAASDGDVAPATGTSIFDPVLCELIYRWFCPPGGLVLDPFAGGSVRGIVASRLGRRYLGIDLRDEQITANEAQVALGDPSFPPRWVPGDALKVLPLLLGGKLESDGPADLVFSCPPYGDLEVYSEDERDLSAMAPEAFDTAYAEAVGLACEFLRPDRFAVFVVGDYRDDTGFYRNLPGRTVAAFEAAGLRLYNEAILVTAVGSLPVRARKQFVVSRKLGKTHQNVLVFCKGDPRKASEAVGKVDFGAHLFDAAPADGGDAKSDANYAENYTEPNPPAAATASGIIHVPATPLGGEV